MVGLAAQHGVRRTFVRPLAMHLLRFAASSVAILTLIGGCARESVPHSANLALTCARPDSLIEGALRYSEDGAAAAAARV